MMRDEVTLQIIDGLSQMSDDIDAWIKAFYERDAAFKAEFSMELPKFDLPSSSAADWDALERALLQRASSETCQ